MNKYLGDWFFRFYVFTSRAARPTTFGDKFLRVTCLPTSLLILRPPGTRSSFFTCLPAALLDLRPSGTRSSFFYVFTDLSAFLTTSGGSIFLLVKKDRGERHAKGLRSRPLESCFYTGDRRGDVRRSYEFAQMQLTRLSRLRRSAYPLASAYRSASKTCNAVP